MSSKLEEIDKAINGVELYERSKISSDNFLRFVARMANPKTADDAKVKWIEMAGIEMHPNGKSYSAQGEFKEVYIVDEEGVILDTVPPLSPMFIGTDKTDNIDAVINESVERSGAYGEAGNNGINFELMQIEKDIGHTKTWDDLVFKYLKIDKNPTSAPTPTIDDSEEFFD